MSVQLDALNAEVARNAAVTAEVVALLKTLAAGATDGAAVQAAADVLKTSNDTLAAAVASPAG